MATARKKQQQVHLKVFTVTSIKFQRDGFFIGMARVNEGDHGLVNRTINFKGDFPNCDIGRSYEAYGALETHPRFGDSYKLSGVVETMPTDRLGVIRYLTDTYALAFEDASAIVTEYGPELRGILDTAKPEQLVAIGIENETAERLLQQWQRSAAEKDIEKMLIGVAGVGTKMIAKINEWCAKQGSTIGIVANENPYYLMNAPRVGWKIADAIAEAMGIAADDPRRMEAACKHIAAKEEQNGHTWTGKDAVLSAASDMLGLPSHKIMNALVNQERDTNALLVIDDQQRCYTPEMLRCEEQLAYGLYRLMTGHSHIASNIKTLDWQAIFDNAAFKPTDEQQEAVRFLLENKVSVLTGGAGVGKSTVQRLALDALHSAGVRRIKLCAPTGKAAKRLSETSGMQATTVHRLVNRLMSADPDSIDARPDVVIVDEASMLDTQVAEWLVNVLPDQCHLIFVGDDNQLPSVGAGRVLYDLISANVPMARLTKVLRQAGESKIISTSHDINRGTMPELNNDPDSDMFLFEVTQPDKVAEHILRLITKAIPEKYGIEPDEITVIAPQYKHECGINALNVELQAVLNEQSFDKNEVRWFDKILREGDKLIWASNNLDRGLVNGEECRVENIYQDHDEETGEYKTFIDLDVSERIPLDELTATHGYAVTVHKAQGSEYPCAIVVTHSVHQFMLTRRLLYTAVTRGKQLGILIGERAAVQKAVNNIREDSRRTALAERLLLLMSNVDATDTTEDTQESRSEAIEDEIISEAA
jgi:exodeoxyribonuclease V alpha subunit